jgi:hypothetical protein
MSLINLKGVSLPLLNIRRWVGRALAGMVVVYGVFMLVMLCLRVLVGEQGES